MCGGVADSLGAGGFCDASVRGISMNHWAEIVLYCPSMWLGLHLSKRDVFEGARVHRGERHSLQRGARRRLRHRPCALRLRTSRRERDRDPLPTRCPDHEWVGVRPHLLPRRGSFALRDPAVAVLRSRLADRVRPAGSSRGCDRRAPHRGRSWCRKRRVVRRVRQVVLRTPRAHVVRFRRRRTVETAPITTGVGVRRTSSAVTRSRSA